VTSRKAGRLRHRGDGVEAPRLDGTADHVGAIATSLAQSTQAIRAELIGSDCCIALGITGRGSAPVLGLCRFLVAAGLNPAASLEAWRGDILCLRVRSLGEGARLRVAAHGVGFEPVPECTGGAQARQNAPAVPKLSSDIERVCDAAVRGKSHHHTES